MKRLRVVGGGARVAVRHSRSAIALSLLCAPCAAAAPAHIGAAEPQPGAKTTEVASYGQDLVWVDGEQVMHRRAGVVRTLKLRAGVTDLDMGPGPGGHATAVYVRCTPSCDLYAFDLVAGRETRLRLSAQGMTERQPTIWGANVAFVRGNRVRLGPLGAGRSRAVVRRQAIELELGPAVLAYTDIFDTGVGNGEHLLRVRGLTTGARERTIDRGVIGEGCETAVGALAIERGTLFYRRAQQCGCASPTVRSRAFDLRRASAVRAPGPLAQRYRLPRLIGTPESEACG